MQAVLNRLQPLPVSPGDAQVFAFPSAPLPPPRPGQTINIPFPPPTTVPPPVVAASAVEVLRYAPEGDVPLAPNLSVTFNQPMVALTGLSDLAAQSVPVKLSPQPAGKWRWIGTKTLAFEPQATEATGTARFPMATKYTVEIPAGTISAGGGTLTKTGDLDLHHPTAPSPGILSQRRAASVGAGDVRRLRPGHRSGCGAGEG